MPAPLVLVVATEGDLRAWADALGAHGMEVVRAASRREALQAVAKRAPTAVLLSERLRFGASLRIVRDLRRHPATQQVPVVLHGLAPLTTAQRLRLGQGAPDACLPAKAGAEEVAAAVEQVLRDGRAKPVELTPAQQSAMKYSRIGTMLMVLGVFFSMPGMGMGGAAGAGADNRAWYILLVPLGGLVSDYATGRVDGRRRTLSWQGWTALALLAAMAAGIALWPGFFRWPGQRS
jgi:ActR/RegA family two-component response regulator